MPEQDTQSRGSRNNQTALIGAGIALAAGAAGFLLARRSPDVHDDGNIECWCHVRRLPLRGISRSHR